MSQELKNALTVIEAEKKKLIARRYEACAKFRVKMNLLISKTPTGDLRNELSELNIMFESILNDYAQLNEL